ncbi:phenylacetate--CoA ligase family protein [Aquimarina mytili]|uniref:Phenylacetate--CoA ligase family protein n=1 Tax=Aquimarina mytili TaxID=874423 RepID=A0A937A870_9FLAO|nr:phenylacetate--CoA ligase family protein [Aquimarina mytili]MBL0686014.1 phenylacetate--CoA ligase family protein [Aquimarina mytili]
MDLLQIFRRNAFWFYDFLRGFDIRDHYRDIKQINEFPTSEFSKNKKAKYLKDILNHAIDTTEFYKAVDDSKLSNFPVINKNLIRDNFEDFTSSKYKTKNCILVSTSGSTGAPFSVLQNMSKRCRNTGDNLFYSKKSGYEIGYELVYIKIWPDNLKRSLFSKDWIQNIVPQSVFKLEDDDIAEFIKKLEESTSRKSFLGYVSAFEKICKYLDRSNAKSVNCNVHSIITISEGLNEYTRSRLQKYFGVTPVSRYSNNENGIIAQEDKSKEHKFMINLASYHVEILSLDQDIIMPNGERGRIVVTDLHNYAMPLIRYDTGDIGTMEVDKNGIPYLASIEGRKLDLIYNTNGDLVPSHISYKLCKYGEYKQFQLVQYGEKEYLIKLNTNTKVDEEKMLLEYKEYLGQDANITIEYVDEIPLLSSGKRREVMNTYHSQL